MQNTPITVNQICQHHGHRAERLLEILHDVQDLYGWLSPQSLDAISQALELPLTKVIGVASFYSFFRLQASAQYEILFSDNVTDQMQGSKKLRELLCKLLFIEEHRISTDGLVRVSTTSCIGLCDQGPALLINQRPLTRLDSLKIKTMAELIQSKVPLENWPQDWFFVDDCIRLSGPLLNAEHPNGSGIEKAYQMGSQWVIETLKKSLLKGRGGAGYPSAQKWQACKQSPLLPTQTRVVVCNADEGEPGTFKDRVLLSKKTDLLIEGMTIAAIALGATSGFIYLRGEYKYLRPHLETVLNRRRQEGWLAQGLYQRTGLNFDIEIRLGAGAYVCGEESALIESLEGKRGTPRIRPPFPVEHGYLGQPTVVNNVETFCCAALIVQEGWESFIKRGTHGSSGTKLLSISGDCKQAGIYEVPFGTTVRELLTMCEASAPQAVQLSGASGITLDEHDFDRCIAFEDLPTAGAMMIFDRERDLFEMARQFVHFFAHESCGFCTPCRVGTHLLKNHMDKLSLGYGSGVDLKEIDELNHILKRSSHCGLGQAACHPVLDTHKKFPIHYERRMKHASFTPAFDLDASLHEARQITQRHDERAHLHPTDTPS
jgi:[NiFe] hydrogenase diaphorase moiety large subunit